VCIPLPAADLQAEQREQRADAMFEKFFNLVEQIKQLEQQALDNMDQ
jgi:hypothetical protein